MASKSVDNLDIDYLAFLVRGINKENSVWKQQEGGTDFGGKNNYINHSPKHVAGVLDSLAYLAVNQERKHAVAVSALLPKGNSPCKLIVAENSDVLPHASDHIRDIFERLADIHGLFITTSLKCAHVKELQFKLEKHPGTETENLINAKLIELEDCILAYSWPKIKQRFFKNDGNLSVRDLNWILRVQPPADAEKTPLLQSLQSIRTSPFMATLDQIVDAVCAIRDILSSVPTPEYIGYLRMWLSHLYEVCDGQPTEDLLSSCSRCMQRMYFPI